MNKEKTFFITESAKKHNGKTVYKCAFCNKRATKADLITHVEKEHKDMIPKDYTAARVVFNFTNKKDHQLCVCGCGKETKWREDLWRYDRYATDACKERYCKESKARMVKKYGKEHLLDDPEVQNKLLANRKISGTYKFSTSGAIEYVGTYEKNFLEFCDKVMRFHARDIEQPGPTVEYEFNGQKHLWITDYYIPSYNLVLDIKDGGSNPNTREMPEYRAKQDAKEKAIREQGRYNYLRLTDNQFPQFILIIAELKQRLLDDGNKDLDTIIRINESSSKSYLEFAIDKPLEINIKNKDKYMSYLIECLVGIASNGIKFSDFDAKPIGPVCVTNYIKQGTFEDVLGVSIGDPGHPNFSGMITTDKDGELQLNFKNILEEAIPKSIMMYEFIGNKISVDKPRNIVEYVTGEYITNGVDLKNNNKFRKMETYQDHLNLVQESFTASILEQYSIAIMTDIALENTSLMTYQDQDGIFIKNIDTGLRSPSYKNISLIPESTIEYIRGGRL